MNKPKFALAEKCTDPGLTDLNRITISDVIHAFYIVITSEPGLDRRQIKEWMAILHSAAHVICFYLSRQETLESVKTPDDTLISEIVVVEDNLKQWLRDNSSAAVRTRHLGQLRLMFVCARSMGFSHGALTAQDEWDQLKFVEMDSLAKRLILRLRRSGIHPRDLTLEHLDAWEIGCLKRGLAPGPTAASIRGLKCCIRKSKLQASFPKLDLERLAPSPEYSTRIEDMHTHVREQLASMVDVLAEFDKDERIRSCERTRSEFVGKIRRLHGYAQRFYPDMKEITDINHILNQAVITACARWGHSEKAWTGDSVAGFLYSLHSVLTVHPAYEDQDWEWMLDLICEFPGEPESKKEARRAARAFNYDYDTLAKIPMQIRKARRTARNLSRQERAWSILCELVMLFLVEYPMLPRCLAECRRFAASANPEEKPANIIENAGRWFFHFSPLENQLRRDVSGPIPRRIAPLFKLYIKVRKYLVRGADPGTLFLSKKGRPLSIKTLRSLVENLTNTYVHRQVPPIAFRDIFAYNWLLHNQGLRGYTTLASILWMSIHGVRFKYDRDYREAWLAKHRRQTANRRQRQLIHAATNVAD